MIRSVNRRLILSSALAIAATPLLGPAVATASEGFVEYAPGVIETALAEGHTVFVDYSATWCGTCRRQERVINNLRATNPAYDEAMTFVRVDWDTYRNHEVAVRRSIPRRSTLLVLKGNQELGRVVAGTSAIDIRQLMDEGL
jgi:thiol-disulfide isomerase/thioredoxin